MPFQAGSHSIFSVYTLFINQGLINPGVILQRESLIFELKHQPLPQVSKLVACHISWAPRGLKSPSWGQLNHGYQLNGTQSPVVNHQPKQCPWPIPFVSCTECYLLTSSDRLILLVPQGPAEQNSPDSLSREQCDWFEMWSCWPSLAKYKSIKQHQIQWKHFSFTSMLQQTEDYFQTPDDGNFGKPESKISTLKNCTCSS